MKSTFIFFLETKNLANFPALCSLTSLSSIASVVTNVLCWGDSTAVGSIQAAGGANETAGFGYTYQWHNAPFGPNGIGQIGAFADSLWADTILAICPCS